LVDTARKIRGAFRGGKAVEKGTAGGRGRLSFARFVCAARGGRYTAAVIRNILFDWSGTLVDDLPAVLEATNHVLRMAGRPTVSLEQFRAEFALPFTLFYDRHVPDVPLPRLEGWFHSRFKQVQDSVTPLPHAEEFLKFCQARGLKLFILSTVRPDHFKKQAAKAGFGNFFDRTYLGVRDKRAKIGAILQENHLAPDETVFIGDMQHDVDTAKAGGVHSCALLTGYNRLEQLRASQPDLIVEHLGELRQILERDGFELRRAAVPATAEPHRRPVVTVGALIFNSAGQVLMVRTHKWSDLWGIPGGKVKWGEPSEDALRREVLEETNLEILDIRFVLVQDCIRSTEFYREEHFVLLNYTCRCAQPDAVRLNEEAREFRWLSPGAALRLPLNQPTRVLLRAARRETRRPRRTA
jgi:phosphoglycolate phosphatase